MPVFNEDSLYSSCVTKESRLIRKNKITFQREEREELHHSDRIGLHRFEKKIFKNV